MNQIYCQSYSYASYSRAPHLRRCMDTWKPSPRKRLIFTRWFFHGKTSQPLPNPIHSLSPIYLYDGWIIVNRWSCLDRWGRLDLQILCKLGKTSQSPFERNWITLITGYSNTNILRSLKILDRSIDATSLSHKKLLNSSQFSTNDNRTWESNFVTDNSSTSLCTMIMKKKCCFHD